MHDAPEAFLTQIHPVRLPCWTCEARLLTLQVAFRILFCGHHPISLTLLSSFRGWLHPDTLPLILQALHSSNSTFLLYLFCPVLITNSIRPPRAAVGDCTAGKIAFNKLQRIDVFFLMAIDFFFTV